MKKDGSLGYGEFADANVVYNYDNAPHDLKFKWEFLFGDLPVAKLNRILMDRVATFSITNYKTADEISAKLLTLSGIYQGSTIMDGTACAGGNTISFAKNGFKVIAIELDRLRSKLLKNNVDVYGFSESVKVYNKNLLKSYSKYKADILFIDPPWGGVGYRKQKSIDLFLGKTNISDLCIAAKDHFKYIAVKTPINFNYKGFKAKLKKNNCSVSPSIKLKRMLLIIVSTNKLQGYQDLFRI